MKNTTDTLKAGEERLRLIIEASPSAMLMVDDRGRITLVNQQAEKLFGYPRAELLGEIVERLVPGRFSRKHPDYRADFSLHPSARAMGAGRELFGRRKDGSEVPIEIGLNPIKTDEGSFVIASIIDITERKRADERFRLVVEAAPSAMIMVNEKGLISLVNTQTERLFGYTRTELLGKPMEILVPERFRAAHPAVRDGFFEHPSARAMGAGRDLFGLRRDGVEVPIEIGLNPISTDEGTFVLASIIDITERKGAEEVLRKSEERLHTIIENLSEGLVLSDLDGHLLHWNLPGLNMFGFSSMEEALLKLPEFEKFLELSTLDGRVLKLEEWPLARILAGEHLADYELVLRRLDRDWSRTFSYGGTIVKEPTGGALAFVTITDITESKQAGEKLRRSQEQLAGVIGSARDAIISIDEHQRIVLFNNAAERMFLFPAEHAIGQPLDRFIPKRFRAAHHLHVEGFGQTPATGRSTGSLGARYGLRADGEEFPLEASISQIDSEGLKLSTFILRDITERKRAEEVHREQTEILNLAPILIRDLSGRIVFWNAGAEQMFGWTADEALDKISHTLLHTEFPRPLEEIKARVLADGHWAGELVHRRKNGERIVVASRWVLHRDKQGRPKAILAVNNDVTEHRRMEEAERSSELRYRRLFESAKDGILILEAASGQIIDVNPFLAEMLGYPKEDLMGKELWEIGIFKDIADSKAAFLELQRQGYIRYEDLPLETKKGGKKQVEFISNRYLVNGSSVIQCNIRDITERKLAERTLKEANEHLEDAVTQLRTKGVELASMTQQLWQASKLATMGELSASIAHELNNPLATVALRTESLLMRLPEDSEQRKPLEIITQEVDRMTVLVNNLLQFSRRSHRQISTLDPREEIANSLELVHYHLRTRKIEVLREFAGELPTIQADRQQLRQLFLNLLTNASDAMPDGGKLTVRATLDGSSATAVVLEFADNGKGIAAENLERIWDPFFTTKPEGKGTGLGLAICRRIVEEHGGTVEIRSQAGRGTTVKMVFPATKHETFV